MNIMNTYTGRQFDPMKITPDDICMEDIAHALSLLCRGGGQLLWFYSVAQHCLNCAEEARARGWSRRMILACLLHDASEAYISDIIRPVKIHLDNYREIEEKIMAVILIKFGLGRLTPEETAGWQTIDNEILDNELKILLPAEHGRTPAVLASIPDFQEQDHREIEKKYLAAAAELLDL